MKLIGMFLVTLLASTAFCKDKSREPVPLRKIASFGEMKSMKLAAEHEWIANVLSHPNLATCLQKIYPYGREDKMYFISGVNKTAGVHSSRVLIDYGFYKPIPDSKEGQYLLVGDAELTVNIQDKGDKTPSEVSCKVEIRNY